MQVNQYSSGTTGHTNLTFIAPGVYETWGNNLSPSFGVQPENDKLNDSTRTSTHIEVSQEDFYRALNFARAADTLNNNYFGLCNNCVDFVNEGLKAAGMGEWAAASYLSDGSLLDIYAKAAEYLCTSPYVDAATSAVSNVLSSASNVSDVAEFVGHMSWLADHANGSQFYTDAANYAYADVSDPDAEAAARLARLKELGKKLGISVSYEPLEQKVTLGVASPIVLDLDGDGIQTTCYPQQAVNFDIDGDGVKDRTAWLSGNDAFLAVDGNGNGRIDGVNELFGGLDRGEGFAKLADYDSNGDGQVDKADERFAELVIWQDADVDGHTDGGELRSASAAGLDAIVTSYTSQQVYQHGNLLGEVSTAIWRGQSIDAIDVYFRYESGAGAGMGRAVRAENDSTEAPAESADDDSAARAVVPMRMPSHSNPHASRSRRALQVAALSPRLPCWYAHR